jgi:UDPglucose 6-dehydrogenase
LNALIDDVVKALPPSSVLVILSQVPPGFTRSLAARLSAEYPNKYLDMFCQVETLVIGQAVERALQPERLMVGSSDSKEDLPQVLAEFLSGFDCPVMPMGYESAELTKIAINMFLASSVATTNTLAELCESIGADWQEISPALKLDRRIGPYAYLAPGLGLSGGHLERDLATVISLAAEHGTDGRVVDSWLGNSRRRRDWALHKTHAEIVYECKDPTIAMWGLAYKPGTSMTKNSPAIYLMNALSSCSLQVYDPEAALNGDAPATAVQAASALEACRNADGLVIATAWEEFASVDLAQVREVMARPVVIDPFGVLSGERCAEVGLSHFRLGSPVAQQGISR